MVQKKYILQTGTTSDGVSIIDVVPIDQADSSDEAPITVSTILPTNSVASSPSSSNSQQITAQVAFVQTQEASEISEQKPHFITVNGEYIFYLLHHFVFFSKVLRMDCDLSGLETLFSLKVLHRRVPDFF